jgi:hypothetical protein
MSTPVSAPTTFPPSEEQKPLSEPQRIINTYVAPSKTFTDIRRNSSWWAPWVLLSLFSIIFFYAVDTKVGFERAMDNQLKLDAKATEKMEQLRAQDPDRYEKVRRAQITGTKIFSYAFPVLLLLGVAIAAAVLMATFNFGLGTQITFKHCLAIIFYGFLPGILRSLLASVSLFAGADPEGFNIRNPACTNLACFMNAMETPRWLYVLGSWIDVVTIWEFFLIGLGFAIVGRIKKSTGIAVLFGWFAILMLGTVAWAAFH